MKRIIKKIPIPITGLALALAATGNLILSYGATYRNIFGVISALILIFFIIKMFVDTKDVLEGLKNPIVASTAPTFTMCLMLLSNYIKPYFPMISFGIWTLGLSIHCILIIYFTVKFIFNFDIKKVFPSYFIVYVGLVVGSITAPTYNLISLGRGIFWFGFISYLCLLPIVIYRTFIIRAIPEPAVPTITIFAAPASLCLVGYMASFKDKNISIVGFLAILSLIMFVGVILYLPKMLKIKFYPSYSAFTFPLAISAIAMKQTDATLTKMGVSIYILKLLVKFQEMLTLIIVVYVLIKYFEFLFINDRLTKDLGVNKTL